MSKKVKESSTFPVRYWFDDQEGVVISGFLNTCLGKLIHKHHVPFQIIIISVSLYFYLSILQVFLIEKQLYQFFLLLLLSCLLFSLIKQMWIARDGMPGFFPLPLLGTIWNAAGPLRLIKDWKLVHHLGSIGCKMFGPITRGWLLNTPVILVHDPDSIQRILSTHMKIYDRTDLERVSFEELLGGGIIFQSNGEKWKEMRNAASFAFKKKALKEQIPIFQEKTLYLISKLEKLRKNETIDIQIEFQKLTFDS